MALQPIVSRPHHLISPLQTVKLCYYCNTFNLEVATLLRDLWLIYDWLIDWLLRCRWVSCRVSTRLSSTSFRISSLPVCAVFCCFLLSVWLSSFLHWRSAPTYVSHRIRVLCKISSTSLRPRTDGAADPLVSFSVYQTCRLFSVCYVSLQFLN